MDATIPLVLARGPGTRPVPGRSALMLLASAITVLWARRQQTHPVDPPAVGGHHPRGPANGLTQTAAD